MSIDANENTPASICVNQMAQLATLVAGIEATLATLSDVDIEATLVALRREVNELVEMEPDPVHWAGYWLIELYEHLVALHEIRRRRANVV